MSDLGVELWAFSVRVRIQISEATHQALIHPFSVEHRGVIEVKGKGEMSTWFLNNSGIAPPPCAA